MVFVATESEDHDDYTWDDAIALLIQGCINWVRIVWRHVANIANIFILLQY